MTQNPSEIPISIDAKTDYEKLEDHNFMISDADFYGSCPDKCCIINLRSRLFPVGNLRMSGKYVQELFETYHGVHSYTLRAYVVGERDPLKSKTFQAFSARTARTMWEEAFREVSDAFV
jgi:hypothetical protein